MPLAGRRLMEVALVGVLTALLWASAPIVNLYGTSRPEPVEPAHGAARWPAPPPVTDAVSVPMLHRSSDLPLRVPGDRPLLELHVERELVERYGLEPFDQAAAAWSGVRGAALTVRIAGVVDDGVDRNLYDGTNRIFVNRRSCEQPTLARAHIADGEVDDRFGTAVSQVREVNIGLCPGVRDDLVGPVVLHEIGHAIGFGHLCDPDDHHGCWEPEMGRDGHRCRIMYASATGCQEWDERDTAAMIRHYPVVPRIAGPDPVDTAARVAHTLVERAWNHRTVVILDPIVDEALRWTAAAAAGALRAPLLVAPNDITMCSTGEFARELGRIADHGAEAILVGPAAVRCGLRIEQWELSGTIARDADELTALALERLPTPSGVVVAALDRDGHAPLGGAAAALAGALRVSLLLAPNGALDDDHLARLRTLSHLHDAITIGGPALPVGRAGAQLRWHHGVEVEHLPVESPAEVSARLAEHEAFAGHDVVLVTRPGDLDEALAAAYAPLTSALLVLTGDRITPETRRLLSDRATAGFIVGEGVTEAEAALISNAVDRPDG